ncbi:MAG: hypothetical protein K2X39_03930, partial [Silvanigrellaceae bacterium]|nr:hypothetical protein [Silvanigrellaceae bacterium]
QKNTRSGKLFSALIKLGSFKLKQKQVSGLFKRYLAFLPASAWNVTKWIHGRKLLALALLFL